MPIHRLALLLAAGLLLHASASAAPADTLRTASGPGLGARVALLAAPVGLAGAATYVYLRETWWSENETSFRLDQGIDLVYALNADKAAHFFGGTVTTELGRRALGWAGVPEDEALLWAAGTSTLLHLVIEVKDGFSPSYGFSVWDLAAGAAGSFYPLAQQRSPLLAATNVKFSYVRFSDAYFERPSGSGHWINDYINQTYWLALSPHDLLPEAARRYWPAPLGLAVGYSVDEALDGAAGGRPELYLGLDVNLARLVPETAPAWLEALATTANFYRLPLPAVRLTPRVTVFAVR